MTKSRAVTKAFQLASLDAQQALTAILAVSLGAFMVFGIGFAHPDVIHNVAHDVRHALAFPCH